MAAPQFYPALNKLISTGRLPEPVKTAVDTVSNKLFYKSYYVEKSVYGESAYHHIVLVLNSEVGLNFFGGEDGFKLLFNPGSVSGTTEIPLSIYYSLPILKYVRQIRLDSLSSVKDYFDLIVKMFNLSKEELFFETIDVFLNDYENPVEEFVDQFNQNPDYSSYPPLIYPSTEEYYTDVIDLMSQLQDRNIDTTLYVLNTYITEDSIIEGFNDMSMLFNRWMGNFNLDTIVGLFIPKISVSIQALELALAFPRTWLKPVDSQGNVIEDENVRSMLTYNVGSMTYDSEYGFEFNNIDSFDLDPSQIGNTGLLIQINNLKFDFRTDKNIPEADADGRSKEFQGIYTDLVAITLPKKWFNTVDNTTLQVVGRNLLIGTGGVSGTIALETVGGQPNDGAAYMNVNIGSWELGFNYFDLTFKQNVITQSSIAGRLKIPKLKDSQGNDAEIYINGHFNEAGDFNLTASEPEGIPFTLFNFVTFNFLTLELGRENDKFYIGTSCQIWFENQIMAKLIGDQIIEIPRLRVYDNGTIEIVGGNGFIPLNISLNLGPIDMAVTGVHYGSTQLKYGNDMRKYNYWGFDGAISIDPLGIDVRGDGIKYYYTTDNDEYGGNGDSFIHIKTLAIDLIIPGTASPEAAVAIIHGMLSLPDPGESPEYVGEVSLKLPKAKIAGGVAMKMQPRYPAFIIDAFIDLPAPIPIGPVGIYGFRGLLGYRYVATKEAVGLTSDDRWYDYYVHPQRGINKDKFIGPPQSLDYTAPVALGAGAVIGTSFDSGTVISARIMLVLSLPTLFMIDGRASILSARLGLESTKEPPFFAFVAWGDDSIEMAMGADFKMPTSNGWILKIYAEVQSGFFFNSPSAWYVNLGTKQNPITAKVLTLVTAQSYLMLSAQGIEAGARVHFELKKRFGPAKVHLYAYLEIGGNISFERPQMGGYVAAGGGIDIDIWIIGISLSLNAILSAEAAKPFLIYAEVRFRACARLGFVRVCKSFTVKLKWEKSKVVDYSPVSPLPSSGAVNRANELVKGIHMLTNDTFDLKFFTAPPTVGQIDKVIPLDTYIEIKAEKGLVPGAVSGKIGGYTFAPQNCVDLIPPKRVVRGAHQLRQVKHRYSIEQIEIKAWNGNSWQDYHPFEAVVDPENRPNVAGLRIGYWQIKEKQYDTIRILATTPFTYMEAGEPGWHIPEVYGITPSTLYCQEELRKETCVNVLNKPLGTVYYPPTQYIGQYINGAYFTLLNVPLPEFEDGEVTYDMSEYMEVTNAENLHGFVKSLSFNNSNGMVIILPEPSVEVKLRFTTNAQGATISYYKSVIDDSTSIVQYELIHQVYKTATEINNNVIQYTNENKPIAKVVINPDDADLVAIQQISEQIAELFETTYDNVSGEVSITEPSNIKLYRELIRKLEELKSKGCSGGKDKPDPKLTELYDQLSELYYDHFIYPVKAVEDIIIRRDYFSSFLRRLQVFDTENPEYRLVKSMGNIYDNLVRDYDKLDYLISEYPRGRKDEEIIRAYYDYREDAIESLNYIRQADIKDSDCNFKICKLYDELSNLFHQQFIYPVRRSEEVINRHNYFIEFIRKIQIFDRENPDCFLIKSMGRLYEDLVQAFDRLNYLISVYPKGAGDEEIIRAYYDYRESAMAVLKYLKEIGRCDNSSCESKMCELYDELSRLFNEQFIYPVRKADELIERQEYFIEFFNKIELFDKENPECGLIKSLGEIYDIYKSNSEKFNYLMSVYPKEASDEDVINAYYDYRKSALDVIFNIKETGDCGCSSDPKICALYNQLNGLYNSCFVPVQNNKQVDQNIPCFKEFQTIVSQVIELVADEDLISLYNRYVEVLINIQHMVGHHEQILRFYMLKKYAREILILVNALGDCNCGGDGSGSNLNCTTSLQQICWLSLEDFQWNLTVPGSEAIEGDFEDMTAAVQKVAQPVWRPNTNYYIRIQLKDDVDDGQKPSGIYNYYYGFKTVGPIGHYHKNPASGYIPPGGNADEYTLTSLRSYIDYNRSYPNADGNILRAKPLFYGNKQCKISVFFNKPSTYHMFQTWEEYLNLPELDGQLHIAIKDPVTDVIIPYPLPVDYDETVPFPDENGYVWDGDDNPQLPAHIQVINNMIENGQLPCEIDLGEPIVPASSYFNVTLMNLRPQKLYTALLYNAFEVTNNNVVSEPVHEFVFQTSRYENFEEQVNSYLIQDEETETERQAVFTVELNLDNAVVAKALDIVSDPDSQINDPLGNSYQHLFDRVIEGVFEIPPVNPPLRTEFHKIINLLTGDVVAVLIKNPEPFNIPKIPLEEVEEMISVTNDGEVDNTYKVLYSKDYSQALIMHTSAKITAEKLDFTFNYFIWNGNQYVIEDTITAQEIIING